MTDDQRDTRIDVWAEKEISIHLRLGTQRALDLLTILMRASKDDPEAQVIGRLLEKALENAHGQ